ncbi:MAG: peptidylprolyl isomerase [Pyrinomonadaceae bacterium]|nr:peptidylprolyl isomerase [Pyrinomonadaceae bacterium]
MSNLTKGVAVIAVILAIGVGLVVWKTKVGGHGGESLNRISKEEMTVLLADANPAQLQQLSANPEAKKKIAENIRQLLAVAGQARKEGLAEDPNVKREMESTRSIVTASLYDKKINEGKGQMPPFSFITEEQVKEFWGSPEEAAAEPSGFQSAMDKIGLGGLFGNNKARRHQLEFQEFLDSKIALAKESGRFPKDKTLTEDETKQAKDDFAKIKIYEEEAVAKKGELGEEFNRNLELQIKLQQAQFLATRYASKNLVEKVKVNDEDIQKYIADHPAYSTADKKVLAEQILSRAKAGEDFAKLAAEFSQDPGSKDKGGLYEGITKGKMVPEFEAAALALEPGNISPNLVETSYGYHIIKLEKKGEGKDPSGQPAETYDARHILIMTTMKDPNNPTGRDMPINETVKSLLEEEKQKKVLDDIVANNPVEVPEDFEIPKPSEDDMKQMQQQMMQQQQQMPMQMPDGMEDEPIEGKPQPKPAPKKK